MIREMKIGEEDVVRKLLAKWDFEEQMEPRHLHIKSFDEILAEKESLNVSREVMAKNVILVAELDGAIVGLCWCTIFSNGLSKQGEIEEFYITPEYRKQGLGADLLKAATDLFREEEVEVAFVWTLKERTTAIEAYKKAGFKRCQELILYFTP